MLGKARACPAGQGRAGPCLPSGSSMALDLSVEPQSALVHRSVPCHQPRSQQGRRVSNGPCLLSPRSPSPGPQHRTSVLLAVGPCPASSPRITDRGGSAQARLLKCSTPSPCLSRPSSLNHPPHVLSQPPSPLRSEWFPPWPPGQGPDHVLPARESPALPPVAADSSSPSTHSFPPRL